ncbi:hypothetical protein P343_15815 [Sporolactobacillus laevolacticus DSM 442]|uniref:Uncharacterized protein n=1 Tax=Sporolactobacillus laevolacticus DSM 442 TaxID=1395513 RepID=V6IUL0_9BACL|nr:hypothetical protein P343_15815 [Sporolactobacillus laevolacticus DSM 442]
MKTDSSIHTFHSFPYWSISSVEEIYFHPDKPSIRAIILYELFKKEDKKGREDQGNAVSSTGAYANNT